MRVGQCEPVRRRRPPRLAARRALQQPAEARTVAPRPVGANPPTDKAPDNAFPGKGKIIV
jgi:hypothetical protein